LRIGYTGPQGYHYHGNKFQYVEEIIQAGLSIANTPPSQPVLLAWAADGFPILYRFGSDGLGNLTLLYPNYQLKYGNRNGNGNTAPCGLCYGGYTNDYQYKECFGDLDECNVIERTITLNTTQGVETFNYFYVIAGAFLQIGSCFLNTPHISFR